MSENKIDPNLLKSMNLKIVDKKLIVDVAMELPIRIMGSGAELNSEYVDQDLMSGDRSLMKKLKIKLHNLSKCKRTKTMILRPLTLA